MVKLTSPIARGEPDALREWMLDKFAKGEHLSLADLFKSFHNEVYSLKYPEYRSRIKGIILDQYLLLLHQKEIVYDHDETKAHYNHQDG